ncbi:MAG: hypothetical protein Q7T26_07700 [Dehalococcoidia bacterium]|nr:hypothetical protein [Dehalococcoidia bacterium]
MIRGIEHSTMIGPLSQLTANGKDVAQVLKEEGEKFVGWLTARGCLVMSDPEFHPASTEDWVVAIVLCDHGKHGLG